MSFLGQAKKRKVFDNLFSFTFVRHPFLRLVSAYKDKVANDEHYRAWRKKLAHAQEKQREKDKSILPVLVKNLGLNF